MTILDVNYSYLKSTDPWQNLAIENEILVNLPLDTVHILFWVNTPCVVMGRFQNPFLECQMDKILLDKVPLVRRQSGGGCVYHDQGNLNYSFITNKAHHNKENNHLIILDALKTFGINAFSTKRVDLFVNHKGVDKKFSGSAFKEKKETAFHHGTLLVDSDIDKLNFYLTPKSVVSKSVSIPSVRSTVVNLSQLNSKITIDLLVEAIVLSAQKFYKTDPKEVSNCKADDEHLLKLKGHHWLLGETPKFTIFDPLAKPGQIEIEIKKMIVTNLDIFQSEFHDSFILDLKKRLVGLSLLDKLYIDELEHIAAEFDMYSVEIRQLKMWFEANFSVLRK